MPRGDQRAFAKKWFAQKGVVAQPGEGGFDIAWSRQPEKLTTPLLINMHGHELEFGIEGVAAVQDAGRPLEVRVFPDEGHTLDNPVHRRGVYENNMQWLTYWLLGSKSGDPADAPEYARWATMEQPTGATATATSATK